MARIDAAIAERARQQLGLITYAQLTDLGCTPRMWQVRLARGELHRAGTRVLQVASTPVSWEQRVLAAQLDAGEGAVVSHLSAAALWGFHGIGRGAVEVTVPACRQVRPTSGVVHRSRRLERVDIGHQGPFTLTQPARTLLDIAPRLTLRQVQSALDHLARDGLLRPDQMCDDLARLRTRGRHGVRKTDSVLRLDDLGPRPESWLERQFFELLRHSGVPLPQCQVELQLPTGAIARVDHCYVEERLVIELTGHGTHSTRRERQADAERAAQVTRLGYAVIEFTYEDLTERPRYVVLTVEDHLGGRRSPRSV